MWIFRSRIGILEEKVELLERIVDQHSQQQKLQIKQNTMQLKSNKQLFQMIKLKKDG